MPILAVSIDLQGVPVAHCIRHFEEPIAGLCRTCNQPFCSRCLVFAFGPKKPPYCVGCALTASGVRVNKVSAQAMAAAAAPEVEVEDGHRVERLTAMDKRVERAQKRAAKAAARAALRPSRFRRGAADPQPAAPPEADRRAPRAATVPAPSGPKANSAHPV